ncbi:MAG: nucleotidyltransferase domain-containing protein [Ignavibacteriae bacterium]|nr:nucleotidyltransferase domain-containing protein [Ignavibacteriota bacterium]
MEKNIENLLQKVYDQLLRLYGKRLRKVILYGSYARGEQFDGSDLDIAVIIDNFAFADKEIAFMSESLSLLSLEFSVTISAIPIREQEYVKRNTPLLLNIKREGIAIS